MLRPRNFDFFEEVLSESDQPETPFQGLDRASLIQEAKRFSAATINVKSCASTLIKLLYLLGQGETLSATEATEIFFGVTKLFQVDNAALRRLMYVALKELSPMVEQAFVASAQLVKDIHSSNDMYRAHAIRTLRKITDASTLTPFERYLKQAIVDKSSCVAGAALVTALHLSYQPETVGMVRRWTSEVAEALKHRSAKVQFAALALMHRLRNADRLSVTRLVQTVQQGPVRSPLAVTLLLRLVTDLVRDDAKLVSGGCKLSGGSSLPSSSTSPTPISQNRNPELIAFLTSCLRHSNDCVVFEAARGLVAIHPVITPKELTPVILVLHMYLTARRPLVQFGAIRILSHVATVYPSLVGPCTGDLENLIQDSNRNIATMAVMTLLRSGSENSLEKLLKEATLFMSDLDEDFRCVVIEAVSDLSQKHPARYPVILQFLSDALRSESGLTYKRTVLEAILRLAMAIPDAHVLAVSSVADFIQDCEYPVLTARVVHFLGEVGPMSDTPNRCLRHVFNRILLETPLVRSAAVSAVGKFAAQNRTTSKKPTSCEMIPGSTVRDLIQQVMLDPDDEVRDRALLVYQTVGGHDVPGCDGEEAVQVCHVLNEIQHKVRQRLLSFRKNKTLSFSAKDSQCLNATRDTQPTSALTAPFNEEQLPPNRLEIPEALKACVASVEAASFLTELYSTNRIFPNSPLGSFLEPFYVTDPMLLTEPDSEYVVRVVRYVYPHAVLLHFSVTNTMEEQWIVRPSISVELDPVEEEDDEGSTQFPRAHIKIPNPVPFVALEKPWLCPNQTGSIFALLRIDQPSSKTLHTPNANVSRALLPPTCTIQSTLHFALSEESPENSREAHRTAHAEQYPLDACSLTVADYLRPWTPTTTPAACNSRPELEVFQQLWETMGEQGQTGGTYVLPDTSGLHTVQAAVQRVVTFYGIHVVGGPKNLPSDSSTLVSHMLHLSGSYLTPTLSPQGEVRPVLIRCRIFISKERLIALEINIRGLDETLRSFLIEELL